MDDTRRLACLAITGPTASGKTGLALELAREMPLEIISMDSVMVFRGMDIGTAKPDAELRERVPHHLVDIVDPEQAYSAGRFAADALDSIKAINRRGRLALIVGGTMLYLRALRDGIASLPERDPALRGAIDARAAVEGWEALHAELTSIDPEAARKIEPTDRQRIQRALEVHSITGRRLSELQRETPAARIDIPSIALVPEDRGDLGRAIAARFQAMLEAGFVDEVRRLRERPGLSAASTSMRAVGYRQIWAWLDGRYSWPEAEQKAVAATRQLAKRQLTWLRGDSRSEKLGLGHPGLGETVRRRAESAAEALNNS